MSLTCPRCGDINAEGALFCGCGAALVVMTAELRAEIRAKRDEKRRSEELARECKWCNAPLPSSGTNRKFCSDEHRKRHWEATTAKGREVARKKRLVATALRGKKRIEARVREAEKKAAAQHARAEMWRNRAMQQAAK